MCFLKLLFLTCWQFLQGCLSFIPIKFKFFVLIQKVLLTVLVWSYSKTVECQLFRSQDRVPFGSDLWSNPAGPNCPLIRLKSACKTLCARIVYDQILQDANDLWSNRNQTIVQKIVRPWPRPNPEHSPADCALKTTSDRTFVRLKWPLIRLNCSQN